MSNDGDNQPAPIANHAVIGGYGVPGRAVAEWMKAHGIPFVVIELNAQIVERCSATGTPIIGGDVRTETTLIQAGIERASYLALTVPVESIVLEVIPVARRLNPSVRIIARCTFISGGLEAMRRGADETVVAEEIAALEFVRRFELGPAHWHTHRNLNAAVPETAKTKG